VESYREMSESFAQQVSDQKAQVENLKSALRNWNKIDRGADQGRSVDRATSPRPRVGKATTLVLQWAMVRKPQPSTA